MRTKADKGRGNFYCILRTADVFYGWPRLCQLANKLESIPRGISSLVSGFQLLALFWWPIARSFLSRLSVCRTRTWFVQLAILVDLFFRLYEVSCANNKLKTGKAAGIYGIRPKFVPFGAISIVYIAPFIWIRLDERGYPSESRIMLPLYKEKGTRCRNYRGITLLYPSLQDIRTQMKWKKRSEREANTARSL